MSQRFHGSDVHAFIGDHGGYVPDQPHLKEDYGVKNPIRDIKFQNPDDHPTAWRNNWLKGCTYGIIETLMEKQQERKQLAKLGEGATPRKSSGIRLTLVVDDETQEEPMTQQTASAQVSALAIISEKIDEAYKEFSEGFTRSNTSGSGRTNFSALAAGRKVGRAWNLNAKEMNG